MEDSFAISPKEKKEKNKEILRSKGEL